MISSVSRADLLWSALLFYQSFIIPALRKFVFLNENQGNRFLLLCIFASYVIYPAIYRIDALWYRAKQCIAHLVAPNTGSTVLQFSFSFGAPLFLVCHRITPLQNVQKGPATHNAQLSLNFQFKHYITHQMHLSNALNGNFSILLPVASSINRSFEVHFTNRSLENRRA